MGHMEAEGDEGDEDGSSSSGAEAAVASDLDEWQAGVLRAERPDASAMCSSGNAGSDSSWLCVWEKRSASMVHRSGDQMSAYVSGWSVGVLACWSAACLFSFGLLS